MFPCMRDWWKEELASPLHVCSARSLIREIMRTIPLVMPWVWTKGPTRMLNQSTDEAWDWWTLRSWPDIAVSTMDMRPILAFHCHQKLVILTRNTYGGSKLLHSRLEMRHIGTITHMAFKRKLTFVDNHQLEHFLKSPPTVADFATAIKWSWF